MAVHQYQRNLYLARLDEAGVELVHHLRPVGLRPGAVECVNVFSHRPVRVDGVDTLVVSAGRTARNDLHDALLAAGAAVERAGDVPEPALVRGGDPRGHAGRDGHRRAGRPSVSA